MLTAKQEAFVKGIIEGKSQAEAYRTAYNSKATDKTCYEEGSKLMNNPKVASRLAELRAQMIGPAIMTAQERLEFLTEVINGTRGEKVIQVVDGEQVEIEVPASMKNRLSAIDIMNKMSGEYTQKVEASVTNAVNICIELSDD